MLLRGKHPYHDLLALDEGMEGGFCIGVRKDYRGPTRDLASWWRKTEEEMGMTTERVEACLVEGDDVPKGPTLF